jgi:hypothetical protein
MPFVIPNNSDGKDSLLAYRVSTVFDEFHRLAIH